MAIHHTKTLLCKITGAHLHGGPFKTLSVKEIESGIISCGGAVRRAIMPQEPFSWC
jgi:sorbitol-specific phosphotransferase system component IIBC